MLTITPHNHKLRPVYLISLLLLEDFAAVGLGVAGAGVGFGVTGEGVALADLLCFEDLEAVGKRVGRFVGRLVTGEDVGRLVTGEDVGETEPGSSPSSQTNVFSLHVKPRQHVPSGTSGMREHGSSNKPQACGKKSHVQIKKTEKCIQKI